MLFSSRLSSSRYDSHSSKSEVKERLLMLDERVCVGTVIQDKMQDTLHTEQKKC